MASTAGVPGIVLEQVALKFGIDEVGEVILALPVKAKLVTSKSI